MTDKIREAFEKWWKDHGIKQATYAEKCAARKGYQAAIASLEPIPRSESGLETLYRIATPLPEENAL